MPAGGEIVAVGTGGGGGRPVAEMTHSSISSHTEFNNFHHVKELSRNVESVSHVSILAFFTKRTVNEDKKIQKQHEAVCNEQIKFTLDAHNLKYVQKA